MSEVAELRLRMYITLFLVIAVAFAILVVLLGALGVSFLGIAVFAVLFFIMQWYVSPALLSHISHLKYVTKEEQPKLYNMVYVLASQAKVPMPRIAISPSKEPNAFVFGRSRKSATLVVHQGLLSMVTDDELYAVLAHEIGHLKHNDVVVMTFVAFIPMIAYFVAISSLFGGIGNSRNTGAYAALIGIFAFVAYFLSELLMLALSRTRELYADSYSADATKKPGDLASALAKITYSLSNTKPSTSAVARSFYIADSISAAKDVKGMEQYMKEIKKAFPDLNIERFRMALAHERTDPFSFFGSILTTHPPTYKRILMLAKMKEESKK
ncbi:MAG: zinc metalloprotease HtpX [Candidatus Micrarchaeaceae archaeon]